MRLFSLLFILCSLNQIFAQKQIKDHGYLIYTDERFYFLPFKKKIKNLNQGFTTDNLDLGFQVRNVLFDIYSIIYLEETYKFTKENFPPGDSIWILPVKLWYEEQYEHSLLQRERILKEWNYIVKISGRRIDYFYDRRYNTIKKMKLLNW
ncbi:MAG: hypothetical protein KDD99_22255 [Bacteroidetes bacterium]|nr:hypothetical protein [Bacteroidota bacterium]